VRSISLDPETDEIAGDLGNFSFWVRQQLRNYRHEAIIDAGDESSLFHVPNEAFGGVCNALKPQRCRKCYPHGRASQDDWLVYVGDYRYDPEEQPAAFARLLDTIRKPQPQQSGVFTPSPSDIDTPEKKKGVIHRLLAVLHLR